MSRIRRLTAAAAAAAGALLGAGWLASPSGGEDVSAPPRERRVTVRMAPGAAASSRPAVAPASGPAWPSKELIAACDAEAGTLRQKLDSTFAFKVQPPFVMAGNMSQALLEQYAAGCVTRPAQAMWSTYFQARPDRVITVLLLRGDKAYRQWAGKLFGDRELPHYGYYRPGERALVMNIDTGGGTLVHELTHALIVYDFPRVPTWFNEGLASLHEQCRIEPDGIRGLPNWRLAGLQEAIRKKTLRPLRQTVTADDFYGPLQGVNYAQARYFCYYLQQKGKLGEFYAHLRAHAEGAEAGVKAIEAVTGKRIEEAEAEMIDLVKTLRFP